MKLKININQTKQDAQRVQEQLLEKKTQVI